MKMQSGYRLLLLLSVGSSVLFCGCASTILYTPETIQAPMLARAHEVQVAGTLSNASGGVANPIHYDEGRIAYATDSNTYVAFSGLYGNSVRDIFPGDYSSVFGVKTLYGQAQAGKFWSDEKRSAGFFKGIAKCVELSGGLGFGNAQSRSTGGYPAGSADGHFYKLFFQGGIDLSIGGSLEGGYCIRPSFIDFYQYNPTEKKQPGNTPPSTSALFMEHAVFVRFGLDMVKIEGQLEFSHPEDNVDFGWAYLVASMGLVIDAF